MRTIVLIDGQNLYHLARLAWAPVPVDRSSVYSWPSYDVELLAAHLVARSPQRELSEVRFYTGVPAPSVNRFWHDFWTNKCRHLRNQGVHVYTGRVNSAGQPQAFNRMESPGWRVPVPFSYQGHRWGLVPVTAPEDNQQFADFKVPGVALTRAGREISKVVELEPVPEYDEALRSYFAEKGLRVELVQQAL